LVAGQWRFDFTRNKSITQRVEIFDFKQRQVGQV
jgi:hypothetical protein